MLTLHVSINIDTAVLCLKQMSAAGFCPPSLLLSLSPFLWLSFLFPIDSWSILHALLLAKRFSVFLIVTSFLLRAYFFIPLSFFGQFTSFTYFYSFFFFLYLLERCLQPLSASFYFSLVSSPPHLFSTIISFIFYSLTLSIFLLFNNFNSTPLLKCHPCVLLKWLCSFFLQVTILSLCPILHVHCPLSFMSTDMWADVLKESVLVCLCMRRWNIEDKREWCRSLMKNT